ncbi:MAG: hypothetical protein C4527_15650 [Candidatus Omnitrophota bacterium]|nr:MAG: hypothetical protein C4527_15650 [Candidatus Omnitrophota bacterium]
MKKMMINISLVGFGCLNPAIESILRFEGLNTPSCAPDFFTFPFSEIIRYMIHRYRLRITIVY